MIFQRSGIQKCFFPILFLLASLSLYPESTPIKDALESIASTHYDSHLNAIIGNFTWEDSGIGTDFSVYVKGLTKDAVEESSVYTEVATSNPVFSDPEAVMALPQEERGAAAYLISGTYRLAGNKIEMTIGVFSLVFNSTVGTREITFPLSVIPSGTSVIPENPEIITQAEDAVGTLFGESRLKVYVTTDRGEGGLYHNGENLHIYVLASEDCFVKIFHIDVTGTQTVQIFPNRFEVNNFLPGGRYLKFPGNGAPFRFSLKEPYGSEYIKVVASTSRFSNNGVDFENLGVATRGLILKEVAVEEQEIMAEAKVSYTIVE